MFYVYVGTGSLIGFLSGMFVGWRYLPVLRNRVLLERRERAADLEKERLRLLKQYDVQLRDLPRPPSNPLPSFKYEQAKTEPVTVMRNGKVAKVITRPNTNS